MSLIFILSFNIFICVINFYLLWQLIRIRKYLKTLNNRLFYINKNLPLIIKEVSLSILTTALEIKKIKEKYRQLKNNISNVQKILTISRIIYKIVYQTN
ncbi:hypothetical protein H6G11_00830 [Cyanobacterium aponinum FACHB-4101]|uniref:hypothetical protein n=1 Tax=Cyanobacterium aponinum TaxID=379064 RepID=UPI0016803A5F|nr:hypothetical protein [Cyanobacterium aponinum]MBD2392799.1 hypothetical protein [Cyanobacterium aponinum FACHB-4101]